MKVSGVRFFYNKGLLKDICQENANYVIIAHEFTDTVKSGDIIKLVGEERSALVKILNINSKDCNGGCGISMKLVKALPGELEIEYDI